MNNQRVSWLPTAIRPPYLYLLIVIVVLIVVRLLLHVKFIPRGSLLSPIVNGLLVAILASYLTVIFVDRSFRNQELERRELFQKTALRRLRKPLNRHLALIGSMYIAASEAYPDQPPQSYDEWFDDQFPKVIGHLDFSQEYPTADDTYWTWFDWSEYYLKDFKQRINQLIQQYGFFLDPEIVQLLEELRDSTMIDIIITGSELNDSRVDNLIREHQKFSLLGADDLINEHAGNLLHLIETYESYEDIDLKEVEELDAWRDDVRPGPGSARSVDFVYLTDENNQSN